MDGEIKTGLQHCSPESTPAAGEDHRSARQARTKARVQRATRSTRSTSTDIPSPRSSACRDSPAPAACDASGEDVGTAFARGERVRPAGPELPTGPVRGSGLLGVQGGAFGGRGVGVVEIGSQRWRAGPRSSRRSRRPGGRAGRTRTAASPARSPRTSSMPFWTRPTSGRACGCSMSPPARGMSLPRRPRVGLRPWVWTSPRGCGGAALR
jgi:hypothetical protein